MTRVDPSPVSGILTLPLFIQPPAAVGITGYTDKLRSIIHQPHHVFDGEHRADLIGGENEDTIALGRLHARS